MEKHSFIRRFNDGLTNLNTYWDMVNTRVDSIQKLKSDFAKDTMHKSDIKNQIKHEIRGLVSLMLVDASLTGKVIPNKHGIGGKYETFEKDAWIIAEFKKAFEFHKTHKSTVFGKDSHKAIKIIADIYKANTKRTVQTRCKVVGFVVHKLVVVRNIFANFWAWLKSKFTKKETTNAQPVTA